MQWMDVWWFDWLVLIFKYFVKVCLIADFDIVFGLCYVYVIESVDDAYIFNVNDHMIVYDINDLRYYCLVFASYCKVIHLENEIDALSFIRWVAIQGWFMMTWLET